MAKTKTTTSGLQDVQTKLNKHADKIEFNDFEHTYTLKRTGKILTSVSNTLTFFNKGLDSVPEEILEKAKQRGNIIHAIAEHTMKEIFPRRFEITPKEFAEEINQYTDTIEGYDAIEHSHYIISLMDYIQAHFSGEVIAVEQPLYNAKSSIAGTPDLVLGSMENGTLYIKIVDGKTGNIRTSSYAQVSIYQAMLMGALKTLKTNNIDNIIFGTEVYSLKTKNVSRILEVQDAKN